MFGKKILEESTTCWEVYYFCGHSVESGNRSHPDIAVIGREMMILEESTDAII